MKKQNRYIRPLYLWTVMIVLFLIVPLGGCGDSQKYNPLAGVSTTEVTDDITNRGGGTTACKKKGRMKNFCFFTRPLVKCRLRSIGFSDTDCV